MGAGLAAAEARRLIAEHGSLAAVLAAHDVIRALPFDRVAGHLANVRQAMMHALRAQVEAGALLPDSGAAIAYLRAAMAHAVTEEVRVLYLNSAFRMIREVCLASGSVGSATIRPREIIRGALDIAATGFILVHNHPSGDPTPSEGDRRVTEDVRAAARLFDLTLVDHLVIAASGHCSFRAEGLL